jgi:hypothetical protein
MKKPARMVAAMVVLFLVCALVPATVSAATVRGRLDRVDGYGRHYPAQYVAVTLRSPQGGRRSAPAYSNAQGIYYFNNVGHGTWVLEVWWSRNTNQPPRAYTIIVNTEPYSDVAPIIVP